MKKALVVVLFCVMALAAISVNKAEAAGTWYTCTISQAGTTLWEYQVKLTDTGGQFTNITFIIYPNGPISANTMYAAALTALANSTNVRVYCDSATLVDGSYLWGIMAAK
jgi:hypothetical protein